MDLPRELSAAIEEAAASFQLKELQESAGKIRSVYLEEKSDGISIVSKEAEAMAYALTRMPACYAAVRKSLDLTLEFTEDVPRTLLDIGAGTGAVLWAADSLIALKKAKLLERESSMSSLGKKLAEYGEEVVSEASWASFDLVNGEIGETAELVTASYILNELREEDFIPSAKKLYDAAEKILLIVEPGTPKAFAKMRKLREYFISIGGKIVAPCPHMESCPMPEEDWCHFTARISRSSLQKKLKEAEAPFEDEKFTFLAVAKKESGRAEARIIRHPQIRSGHIILSLCKKEGPVQLTLTKKDGQAYKLARKAEAGDSFDE